MTPSALKAERSSSADFRPPQPEDRVIALRAVIEAKGNALPTPGICHGYVNCCSCPPCKLRSRRGRNDSRRLAA